MTITAQGLSKRFGREWIFKSFDYQFEEGSYAILGNNGSGKSTLLKTLAGIIQPTRGGVRYHIEGESISPEQYYSHSVYVAPYADLIEEFTLRELFAFYRKLKPINIGFEEFLDRTGLGRASGKTVRDFSSGMKQKAKLGLALLSDAQVIFLDEPTSNLDKNNSDWFLELLAEKSHGKLILMASNIPKEYQSCRVKIDLSKEKNGG